MTRRSWKQAIRPIALAAGVALALGIGGSAIAPAGAATLAGAATAKKATTRQVVRTATVPGMGVILVDAQRHALYTHTDADGHAVACTGACETLWPPLTVATGVTVKAPGGVKHLSTNRDTHQVTEHGLPLYRFSKDTGARQANGDGLDGFGGTWHVVTVKATKNAKAKDTTKDTTKDVTPSTNAGTGGVSF